MSKKTLSPEGDEPDNRRSFSSVNANEEFGPQSSPPTSYRVRVLLRSM